MSCVTNRSFQTIAVIGQGYVGLPLALLFANKGRAVIGLDVDMKKIASLRQSRSYLPDVRDEEIAAALNTGRFYPTDRWETLREADAIIICVPTPLNETHAPDLTYLERATVSIGRYLREGQLVVLESSTYPGTTRELLQPLLERESGLKAGEAFHIGYSPERIDPGNTQFAVERIPKVVSGLTDRCAACAEALYSGVFDSVVKVSTPEVAELTKLVENAHRLINISFMNEIAMLCARMNIDVWEVIEAAKTKSFGFTAFYPGPGIGGHCIPVDPLYLQWKAQQFGLESRFIRLSDEINRAIPRYIVDRLQALLPARSDEARPRILLCGVAYKRNVNDVRESPALELIPLLEEAGFDVAYHDPYIPQLRAGRLSLGSIELTPEALKAVDCALIFTDHSSLPLELIVTHAPLVFDTRNATAGFGALPHVYRLGTGGPRSERVKETEAGPAALR